MYLCGLVWCLAFGCWVVAIVNLVVCGLKFGVLSLPWIALLFVGLLRRLVLLLFC